MYATALQQFIYPGVEKSPGKFDPAPCNYWVKDVFEVVSNRLRLDRDHIKPRPSGITSFRWLECDDGEVLEQVTYISVVISCDGGGGSFKVAATIAVRESDHCRGLEEIGWANCAEDYDILSKALLPEINEFLLKLKKESVLFAWIPGSDAWDFVFISADITTSHEDQLLWDEENERVCYRYESAPESGVYMQKSFEKLSREDLSKGIKLQIIAIKLRLVCDLRCMCMLQNRPFLSGSQCAFCGKCASDWEPSYERSISDVVLFTSADHKNWMEGAEHKCGYSRAGFRRNLDILLSAIALEDRIIPRLHEELGLVSYIYHLVMEFAMDHVENDFLNRISYYKSLYAEVKKHYDDLLVQMHAITGSGTYDGDADMALYSEYKRYKEAYSKHGRNIDEAQFPIRKLSAAQKDKVSNIAKKIELDELCKFEFAKLAALEGKISACNAKLKEKIPFKEAKKKSALKAQLERLFSKHGVDAQAYHGESLVGNHTKKFLAKNQMILCEVESLLLEKIDEQHPSEQVQSSGPTTQTRTSAMSAQSVTTEHGPASRDAMKATRKERVSRFCSKVYILTAALDVLFSAMSCFKNLEKSDIDELQRLQQVVGNLWRELGLGARKPKLHILEAHACHFIRTHGPLGFVTEEGVERLHAVRRRTYTIFGSIRNAERKETLVQNRLDKLAPIHNRTDGFQIARMRSGTANADATRKRYGQPTPAAAVKFFEGGKKIKMELIRNWANTSDSISSSTPTPGSD